VLPVGFPERADCPVGFSPPACKAACEAPAALGASDGVWGPGGLVANSDRGPAAECNQGDARQDSDQECQAPAQDQGDRVAVACPAAE
jgi:hypothetical protein